MWSAHHCRRGAGTRRQRSRRGAGAGLRVVEPPRGLRGRRPVRGVHGHEPATLLALPSLTAAGRAKVHVVLAQASIEATRWSMASTHLVAAAASLEQQPDEATEARRRVLAAEVRLAARELSECAELVDSVLEMAAANADVRCRASALRGRSLRARDLAGRRSCVRGGPGRRGRGPAPALEHQRSPRAWHHRPLRPRGTRAARGGAADGASNRRAQHRDRAASAAHRGTRLPLRARRCVEPMPSRPGTRPDGSACARSRQRRRCSWREVAASEADPEQIRARDRGGGGRPWSVTGRSPARPGEREGWPSCFAGDRARGPRNLYAGPSSCITSCPTPRAGSIPGPAAAAARRRRRPGGRGRAVRGGRARRHRR